MVVTERLYSLSRFLSPPLSLSLFNFIFILFETFRDIRDIVYCREQNRSAIGKSNGPIATLASPSTILSRFRSSR